MVVKAAVIQIDRPDNSLFVITDKAFGMDEARFILIQTDSCIQQSLIMRFCQGIGKLFVRYARQDDFDINTALGSILKGCFHFPVQNQIRCHDVDIISCMVKNIHINRLAHFILIQRAVGIRNNISFLFRVIFLISTAYIAQTR